MADQRLSTSPRSSRLRRWALRLGFAAMPLAIVLYFTPAIVARCGLTGWLIGRAAADLRGSVHVGGARLGWFYEPELYDVELRDEEGRVVLSAPRVSVDRTLLNLTLNSSDLGTVTVERPTVALTASGDETNLERALAAYLEGESTGPRRTALNVTIQQGDLLLDDADVQRKWSAAGVDAAVVIPADRAAAITITCKGRLNDSGRASNLDLTLAYRIGRGGAGLPPQIHVVATADALPAAAVATFVRRVEPGLRLDGVLAGSLAVTWDDQDPDAPALRIDGRVVGERVSLLDPRLGNERLNLTQPDLACKLTWAGGRLTSDATRLDCDFGKASVSGVVDLSGGMSGLLRTPGVTASCDLDLARLAPLLAKWLQNGTRVTSGRLVGEVRSSGADGEVVWSGRLLTVDLRGEHQGQPLAWDNPVTLEFAGRQRPDALPRVDRFRLLSEVGRLELQEAADDRLVVSGNLDLGLLARKLGQFVDLGDVKPAGAASGRVTLTRDRAGNFGVKGEATMRDLKLAAGKWSLHEPTLKLTLDAAGRAKGPTYRLDSGSFGMSAGAERLTLDLLEPVVDLAYVRGGYVRVGLKGELGRWKSWLGPLVDLPAEWQAGGGVEASARLRLSPESLDVDTATATVAQPRLVGAGLNINEPQLTLKPGLVKWDRKSRKVEVEDSSIVCPALTVQLTTLTAELGDGRGLTASGRGRVVGDAAKLQRWLPALTKEPIAGQLDGPLEVSLNGGRISGSVDLAARSLTVGDPANPTWTEPVVRLTAKGRFEPETDLVVVDELKLEAAALGASASGRVAKLSTSCDLLLTGSLGYELERWQPQLRQFLGKDARVAGRDRKPFRVEGSLAAGKPLAASQSFKGEAAFGWQVMHAYGCSVGPATVQARALGDGWVRFDRIEADFNRGKLKAEPFIKLDEASPLLVFGKNTGVERAQLTAGMSEGSLGYAVPLLAGLRDPAGEVSVVIDGSKIPITDPLKADVWGKLIVHSARATPGPVLTELARGLKLPLNLNLSRELVIPFRLYQGRVYHQNLELPLGEVTLKSSGSVGLDGSLSIVVEMPVPARWLGKNAPKTAPIIKLPIGGTLAAPAIDPQALQQIAAQYLKDAAADAVKGEIEKGLRKWFQPPMK